MMAQISFQYHWGLSVVSLQQIMKPQTMISNWSIGVCKVLTARSGLWETVVKEPGDADIGLTHYY